MKAFVVEHYGKDGLRAADLPEPVVGDGDVLVRVSAAAINPLDTMVRNGVPELPVSTTSNLSTSLKQHSSGAPNSPGHLPS